MAKKTGLVLTGGSVRGIATQAGALLALEERGLRFDAVVGSSAGAIVGALYCSGKNAREVADRLGRVRKADFVDPDMVGAFRALVRGFRGWTGYYRGEALLAWLRAAVGASTRLEDCKPPLSIAVTNVSRAFPELKTRGPLAEWARASASVPLAYQLARVEGELYADGGAADNVPASQLARLETDLEVFLIVSSLHVLRERPAPDESFLQKSLSAFRGTRRILDAVVEGLRLDDLEVGPGREVRVLRLDPGPISFDEPEKLPAAIQRAYEDAKRQLDAGTVRIDDLLP